MKTTKKKTETNRKEKRNYKLIRLTADMNTDEKTIVKIFGKEYIKEPRQ